MKDKLKRASSRCLEVGLSGSTFACLVKAEKRNRKKKISQRFLKKKLRRILLIDKLHNRIGIRTVPPFSSVSKEI